jgi:hypothetical protein
VDGHGHRPTGLIVVRMRSPKQKHLPNSALADRAGLIDVSDDANLRTLKTTPAFLSAIVCQSASRLLPEISLSKRLLHCLFNYDHALAVQLRHTTSMRVCRSCRDSR